MSIKEFVVDRSKWLRGEGAEKSFLRRSADGCMCCLGHLGEACGVSPDKLQNYSYPIGDLRFARYDPAWPEWLFSSTIHEPRYDLAALNDDEHIPDDARERMLAKEFAKYSVTVRFVDGPVAA